MGFCASRYGRSGCAVARFSLMLLVLGLFVSWEPAAAQQARPIEEKPPTVTLRTLITGTCQEIHRYAESVLGTGVVRSVAEVRSLELEMMFSFSLNVILLMTLTTYRLIVCSINFSNWCFSHKNVCFRIFFVIIYIFSLYLNVIT